jgi:hypothetical protein
MTVLALAMGAALAAAPDPATLRHDDIASGRPAHVARGFYGAYETSFGFTVAVGDRLTLAVPLGATVRTTTSSPTPYTSDSASVQREYYTHVANGSRATATLNMIAYGIDGSLDPADYMAPQSIAGAEVVITRIKLVGSRKHPWVWAECSFVNGAEAANRSGVITVGDLDDALGEGEVASDQFVPKSVAIARLAQAQDLLQLGVYTAAEYEAERARYLPFAVPDSPMTQ